ncbi:MAG: hypothetical protein NC084_09745 [Bacteroides sp.]|nr:hypothetical protein [Roseburia sp.]MCM1462980.1 hypothetical protein [Bacteroides sp.]
MNEILNVIYSGLLTVGITVVGFFLKRCFSDLDGKAEKAELQKCAEEVKEFRSQYATKEEVREIRTQMNEMKSSIEFLKEETVRKSDFIRVTTEISAKIDDLSAYLRGKF